MAGGLFYKQKKISRFYFNLLIFILISGYVLLTEYIQHFTPTRDPCLWDGLGGISGIVIGLLFVNSYWNRPENKE